MPTRPTADEIRQARDAIGEVDRAATSEGKGFHGHELAVIDKVLDWAEAEVGTETATAIRVTPSLTLAEVQALPVGAVVTDRDGDEYTRVVPPSAGHHPAHVWLIDNDPAEHPIPADWLLAYPPVVLVSKPE